MAKTQDIKRRIRSVKNTMQVTKAMKMVASAKLRRAQERTRFEEEGVLFQEKVRKGFLRARRQSPKGRWLTLKINSCDEAN